MNFDAALNQLAEADYDLPEQAILWLRENWAEAGPLLIGILRRFVSGKDRSERTVRTLFYTTYLMAEQRDTDAFGPLCDLASLPSELLDETMGWEWITETLPSLLTGTFGGDVQRLQHLIEDRKADEFVRSSGMDALIYLTMHDRIDRWQMHSYLGRLFETLQPRSESHIWTTWSIAIGSLGFEDHRGIVKSAFDHGYIPTQDITYLDFEKYLDDGLSKDDRAVCQIESYAPPDDVVALLSTWYAFSDQRKKDDRDRTVRKLLGEDRPVSLAPPPGDKIGRNAPCPCGSGKKYKKCCLHR